MSNWKELQKTLGLSKSTRLVSGEKAKSAPGRVSKTKSSGTRKTGPRTVSLDAVLRKRMPVSESLLYSVPTLAGLSSFQRDTEKTLAGALAQDDTSLLKPIPALALADYPLFKQRAGTFVALDCEFVGTGLNGTVSELARVSIVNYFGYTLLDTYVRPQNLVTDWRTKYSGITPALVRDGLSFKEAQQKVHDLLQGKVLVGHAIANDLRVLLLSHPKASTIDTQVLQRYRDNEKIKGRPGLRRIVEGYLGLTIQTGSHSSLEDAQATMLIFRLFKTEYLAQHRIKAKGH